MAWRRRAWWALAGALLAVAVVVGQLAGRHPVYDRAASSGELGYLSYPAWSEDGQHIAALASAGRRYYVVILAVRGASARVLARTSLPERATSLRWEGGRWAVLYTPPAASDEYVIRRLLLADGRTQTVARGVSPAPAPRGRAVAYLAGDSAGVNLYVWREGAGVQKVTSNRTIRDLRWSPDARKIAYVYTPVAHTVASKQIEAGFSLSGHRVAVAAVESGLPASEEIDAPGGRKDLGLGWRDDHTLVFFTGVSQNGKPAVRAYAYDVSKRRLTVLLDGLPATYFRGWVSERAAFAMHYADPGSQEFRVVDLGTGDWSLLRFPQPVAPALSPDGGAVAAIGADQRAIYYARHTPGSTPDWKVAVVAGARASGPELPAGHGPVAPLPRGPREGSSSRAGRGG